MGQQYSHLSSEERILIEKLHCEQHLSVRKIAEEIGRDKSTVSRELRRGLWFASNENGSYRPYRPKRLKTGPWTLGPFYSALAAQRKADLRRRGSRKPRRMDSDRPEAVGSRKGFGHFESDTVVGAAPSRRCMNTQVERRSRRLFARLVDDKSASATARAEYEIFKDIPPAARVDRTWDNGTEASLHMLVDEALGMLTYFADPYSSWQRGSNENRNGRIRRYLPKGTGFEDLAQEDLDAIVGEINDTPMKLLGYKTPNEVWDEEIAKLQSKAASPNTSVALTN